MALVLARFSRLPSATRPLLLAANVHSGRVNSIQHSVQRRDATVEYVPGGPILRGGPNDPTPFPEPSKSHGSYHWSFERLLSAALIPLTASAAVVSGSAYPVVDGILAISLVIHSHIGFEACRVDYIHERKFPVVGQIAKWGIRALTTGALVGVYSFNTQDVGLTELIKRTWTD